MKRRTVLQAGLAFGVIGTRLDALGLTAQETPPRVIVLQDIDADTNLDGLRSVMAGLVARQVPFACVIDPSVTSDTALMPDNPIAQLVRDFYFAHPGLIELAPMIANLDLQRPYFQARLASLAVAQLAETLGVSAAGDHRQAITTVACVASDRPQMITGVRAAGVRTVLAVPQFQSEALSNRQSDNGILHLIGGKQLNLGDPNLGYFEQSVASRQGLFTLSAKRFGGLDRAVNAQPLAAKIDVLKRLDVTGQGGAVLPRDIMIRDGNSFARHIALHILDAPPSDPELQAGVAEMVQMLTKAKMGFSVSAAPPKLHATLDGLAFWLPTAALEATPKAAIPVALPVRMAPPVWASFSTRADTKFAKGERDAQGQEIVLRTESSAWRGIDAKGRYHQFVALEVADNRALAEMPAALNPLSDSLVVLQPQALVSPAQRNAVLRALNGFRDDAVTEIIDLPRLIAQSLPPDPLLLLYRKTQAFAPALVRHVPMPVQAGEELAREAWLQDASAAWRYFEKMTNRNTGLCTAANNFGSSSGSRYDRVTMWDIGSHLNALMAAHDLKLISKADFQKQCARILNRLTGRTINGLNLPPEEINVVTGRSTRNFNASDTGRLLASLANLAKHPMADTALVNKVVKGWDLQGVILDGRLQAISRGAFVPADSSQYAHYSTKGLARWGIDAKSPFAGFDDATMTDQNITFLERLQLLGPVGTEPVLLEALEHGFTAPVDYLIDVLFTAMVSEYAQTQRVLCPSETPLDRSPWFVYQGYQVGDDAGPWKVGIVEPGKIEATPVDASNSAISCKSAYLWAAVLEHPYATLLLKTVRAKARDAVGFAACIYVGSGEASTDYTDINTNGIILQSIAYRLGV